ncbi:hypothetical protein BDA96_03G341500 [Sorghum bicolor]|uniref:Uncharacterized protein n=1 Tax=Sorghum bicolor TaxID=4558 RepID=A0A921UPE0_SORBI|nr:hypothetical protein BDA96_03G341500 [Sorghum bicolor]
MCLRSGKMKVPKERKRRGGQGDMASLGFLLEKISFRWRMFLLCMTQTEEWVLCLGMYCWR